MDYINQPLDHNNTSNSSDAADTLKQILSVMRFPFITRS